ncbi:MAG TPA: aspartate kinase [Chitinophagaceae bacterium]|nr:aspartate kinase [Chitinophagaceae bacterium]
MKVFKFGGASIDGAERIRNLQRLVQPHRGEKILLVISAMGKTTNALEKVVTAFHAGEKSKAQELFEEVKQQHRELARALLDAQLASCESALNDFFTEVDWVLNEKPARELDYYYDQIVCTGELYSSVIVSAYLQEAEIENEWLDVRDILRTDDNFRDAKVDWEQTRNHLTERLIPAFERQDLVVTQGFIAATGQNESTTLGREGSDYSAAVFANLLDATELTIWKDVPAVMNSDPRKFPDATAIRNLDYGEVIEMAYYGAQVIHPKTVKPLQNKKIPLYVKSFLDPDSPGTVIADHPVRGLPPIIVLKEKQVLLRMSSLDFSFIGESHVSQLYRIFEKQRLRPNLTQNTAISFICVCDDHPGKIEELALAAAEFLDVEVQRGYSLLTIRHYDEALFQKLTQARSIILRQQTPDTVQAVLGSQESRENQ